MAVLLGLIVLTQGAIIYLIIQAVILVGALWFFLAFVTWIEEQVKRRRLVPGRSNRRP